MCDALQTYLFQNCLSREWFAGEVGIGVDSLSRYINGKRIPSKDIMQKIYEVTGGHVRPDHFYDLPEIQRNLPPGGTGGECEMMRPSFVPADHGGRGASLSPEKVSCGELYRLPQDIPLLPEVFHT